VVRPLLSVLLSQHLQQKDMTVEEYKHKMEVLMMRAEICEELRISMDKFQSGLCYDIRDRVELLPYTDLNELV